VSESVGANTATPDEFNGLRRRLVDNPTSDGGLAEGGVQRPDRQGDQNGEAFHAWLGK
jgi:hypothetical protein